MHSPTINSQKEIDLSNLKRDVYIIKFKFNGEKSAVRKIIKL